MGMDLSCLWNLWDHLVRLMAVLCKLQQVFLVLSCFLTIPFPQVYDTPEQHPRIHPREREFILQSLGSSVDQDNSKKPAVPWIAIVTSKALWINTFGQFGCIFGVMTLITQMPSYFKHIHGWGSEATGLLSGLPHLPLVVLTIAFSVFADNLLSSERMTRNNVRRLSAFVGKI